MICKVCGGQVNDTALHSCKPREEKKCEVCGKMIKKVFNCSRKDWIAKRFCSQRCGGKLKLGCQRGEANLNWKGGRIVFPDGRVHIYKPDHPNCTIKGYVFEHHLVMEGSVGRHLDKKSERVVHIDGNHGNNDLSNLKLQKLELNSYKEKRVNGVKRSLHRRTMEDFLGRRLGKDEVVHHINGDKQDNSIENLEVMSNSEHARLHRIQQLK